LGSGQYTTNPSMSGNLEYEGTKTSKQGKETMDL
jgi:hypothetical protein